VNLWHLGTLAPNYGWDLSVDTIDDCAVTAERLGYDSLWVTDHVAVPSSLSATYGSIAEALVSVGYLAAKTEVIAVGVSALVVPQRPLLLTLKQVMTAQFLCRGRLLLAVAAGWTAEEFANLEAKFGQRSASLERWETVVGLVASNGPGRVDFEAEGIRLVDATIAPGFVDGKAPPTWIAGHAGPPLRRAARTGVWHPVGRSISIIGELADRFRRYRPDGRIVLRVMVSFNEKPNIEALDNNGRCRIEGPEGFIVEQLLRYQSVGVDGFVVDLLTGSEPLVDRLERFATEVRPQLL